MDYVQRKQDSTKTLDQWLRLEQVDYSTDYDHASLQLKENTSP